MKNKLFILLLLPLVFSGCTVFRVGPDYKGETFSGQKGLTNALNSAAATNSIASAFWWERLNDPILTDLVRRSLATNRDIRVAEARLRQTRAQLGIARAAFLPGLDGSAHYSRFGQSDNGAIYSFGNIDRSQYAAGFDAVWELDIFGGKFRKVESAIATYQSYEAARDAVMVSLAAEVATVYLSYRTAQQRLLAANTNVGLQSNTLVLVQSQYKSGLASELPVQQASYNLQTTLATVPGVESDIEAYANALAVLTGQFPGELQVLLKEAKDIPSVQPIQFEGIPAETIRNRPDIRAAERQVAAAVAEIGVAESDLYPKFALNGSVGLESLKWSNFTGHDSMAYSFGPQASWAIFRGGSIRNNIKAKTAVQEEILAAYESAVLSAVREVRDALMAYQKEQQRHDSLLSAVESARKAVVLSENLYKNGMVDFSNVLDSQRSLSGLSESEVISRGTVSTRFVQLYKALGGGWQTTGTVKR